MKTRPGCDCAVAHAAVKYAGEKERTGYRERRNITKTLCVGHGGAGIVVLTFVECNKEGREKARGAMG